MAKLLSIVLRVKTQLIIILFLTVINLLAHFGFVPSVSELTQILRKWFDQSGLPLVALCSLLENIVGFNVYFPGSIVILTAMSLTAGNPQRALITFFWIVIPSMLAHNINFLIGRYSRNSHNLSQTKKEEGRIFKGTLGNWFLFMSTFWHPHFAAVTSVASGSSRTPYKDFLKYFLVSSILWNSFWGVTMYFFGRFTVAASNLSPLFYTYLFLWLVWDLRRILTRNTRQTE